MWRRDLRPRLGRRAVVQSGGFISSPGIDSEADEQSFTSLAFSRPGVVLSDVAVGRWTCPIPRQKKEWKKTWLAAADTTPPSGAGGGEGMATPFCPYGGHPTNQSGGWGKSLRERRPDEKWPHSLSHRRESIVFPTVHWRHSTRILLVIVPSGSKINSTGADPEKSRFTQNKTLPAQKCAKHPLLQQSAQPISPSTACAFKSSIPCLVACTSWGLNYTSQSHQLLSASLASIILTQLKRT